MEKSRVVVDRSWQLLISVIQLQTCLSVWTEIDAMFGDHRLYSLKIKSRIVAVVDCDCDLSRDSRHRNRQLLVGDECSFTVHADTADITAGAPGTIGHLNYHAAA